MQCSVENNPVQFSLKWLTMPHCIIPDPVDTDVNICNNWSTIRGKAKCDDVSKEVVAKKSFINGIHRFVTRKNKVDRVESNSLRCEHAFQKLLKLFPPSKRGLTAIEEETYIFFELKWHNFKIRKKM